MHPTSPLRRLTRLFVLIAFESFFVASTATEPSEAIAQDTERGAVLSTATIAPQEKPRPSGPVVVVTLDGVRWQEVFGGADQHLAGPRGYDVSSVKKPENLMPNLYRLMGRGVALGAPGHGVPPTASGSFISLPGYIEMFTGMTHVPCPDNNCQKPHARTVIDEIRYTASSNEDVAVVTSWPAIMRGAATEPARVVMATGRDYGFNRQAFRYDNMARMLLWSGDDAYPYPGDDDNYRPDFYTGRIGARYLKEKKPRFLFLGLGDGDEYAHRNDYHGYINSLQEQDRIIGDVMKIVDGMGERGKATTIIVTCDHGRASDFQHHGPEWPESGRIWMVAAGGQVPRRGFAEPTTARRLADLAPTIRVMMGLPPVDDGGDNAGHVIDEFMPD